ncbi:MAG: hypothetical protein AAFX06_08015 [Planctomycetota bacterium]
MENSPLQRTEEEAHGDSHPDTLNPPVEQDGCGTASTGEQSIYGAILRNTELLEQVLSHIAGERLGFDFTGVDFEVAEADIDEIIAVDENAILRERNDGLEQLVEQLRSEVDLLNSQNGELASKVARKDVVRSVSHSTSVPQTLTWEQRKQQILDEMENDSFDAESFLSTLSQPVQEDTLHSDDDASIVAGDDPIQYVTDLNNELDRLTELVRSYEEATVESQTIPVVDDSVAAAIEADDVVQEEREKLRQLQAEWEERFRETEIEISLERAKLSRERQEVETINEQLANEVDELRRQIATGDSTKAGTRWMAKLGLISNT